MSNLSNMSKIVTYKGIDETEKYVIKFTNTNNKAEFTIYKKHDEHSYSVNSSANIVINLYDDIKGKDVIDIARKIYQIIKKTKEVFEEND